MLSRSAAGLLASLSLVACGGDPPEGSGEPEVEDGLSVDAGAADASSSLAGFRIETPELLVRAGEEVTYCYYTTLPTEVAAGVKKWQSQMTEGSHHLILYFTERAQRPDGTLTTDECGIGSGGSLSDTPIWTYAAQEREAEFTMPEGVGMAVGPRQPVFVQMHYLNASDEDLMAHVTISAETYEADVDFEPAYAYITYHTGIAVPPGEAASAGGRCEVPAGAKFFTMSTHSHQFTTRAQVRDGAALLVDTENWEHPAIESWVEAPYYQFSGDLEYQCDYFNHTGQTVRTGDSAEHDEMCMAIGYFFPGTGPLVCLNDQLIEL